MPVKTRAKAAARGGQLQRIATQFGELETTPTSRHHQAEVTAVADDKNDDTAVISHVEEARTWPNAATFGDGFEGFKLDNLDSLHPYDTDKTLHNGVQWSETDSLAKRSSPVNGGQTPAAEWEFEGDESLPPLSTPRSGRDQLPDTAPLPASATAPDNAEIPPTTKKIDFSETASTARRSSPVGLGYSARDVFDFDGGFQSSPSPPSLRELIKSVKASKSNPSHVGSKHLSMDNIYDATPPLRPVDSVPFPNPNSSAERSGVSDSLLSLDGLQEERSTRDRNHQTATRNNAAKTTAVRVCTSPGGAPNVQQSNGKRARPSRDDNSPDGAAKKKKDETSKLSVPASVQKKPVETTVTTEKGSRRKQRRKSPLQFEEVNQQLIARPADPKSRAIPKARMPIVSALRDSAQPSSPHPVMPKKRTRGKNAQPRKRAKKEEQQDSLVPKVNAVKQYPVLTMLGHSKKTIETEPKPAHRKPTKRRKLLSPASPYLITSPQLLSGVSEEDSRSIASATSGWVPDQTGADQAENPTLRRAQPSMRSLAAPVASRSPVDGDVVVAAVSGSEPVISKAPRAKTPPQRVGNQNIENAPVREPFGLLSSNALRERNDEKQTDYHRANLPFESVHTSHADVCDKERDHRPVSRRASRNFSVSAKGSPLPIDSQGSPYPSHQRVKVSKRKRDPGSINSKLNEGGHFFERIQRLQSQPDCVSTQPVGSQARTTGGGNDPSNDDYSAALQRQHCKTMDGVRENARLKILSSLQDFQNGLRQRQQETGSADACVPVPQDQDQGLSGNAAEASTDGFSLQLHNVIGAMTKQLRINEEDGHKIAEVYRTNTAECVDKIGKRQEQERRMLIQSLRADAAGFGDAITTATRTVQNHSQLRKSSLRELKQESARRLGVYEVTIKNLRALNRQMLDGAGPVMNEGSAGQEY